MIFEYPIGHFLCSIMELITKHDIIKEKSDINLSVFISNFAVERNIVLIRIKHVNMNINMKEKTLLAVLAVIMLSGCGGKKAETSETPVKVKTMTVGTASTLQGQTYTGTIEEENGSMLSFAAMGTVESINVQEGQFVSKGQLIGVVNATSARNAHAAAVAAKEQALDAQKRMKMLHDNGSLPEIKWVETQTQVRQATANEQIARKSLSDTRLYAPYSGYIVQKLVESGANVGPGVPVVRLVRIDRVKVKISVPEEEIGSFSDGMGLRVAVSALNNKVFEGRVTEKNVSADALSRSYDVKAIINNPRHELLPGMIAEVATEGSASGSVAQQIALPAGLIQLDADNKTFVWTVAGGKAKKTYINIGENIGDKVAVTDGLRPGDKVITEGQQKVSTGMKVSE